MNKRDLKADLRAVREGPEALCALRFGCGNPPLYGLPIIAEHAIERALEAEALVRELVEALEKAIEEVNHPICGPGSVVGDLEEVLAKAKEVLGDEN